MVQGSVWSWQGGDASVFQSQAGSVAQPARNGEEKEAGRRLLYSWEENRDGSQRERKGRTGGERHHGNVTEEGPMALWFFSFSETIFRALAATSGPPPTPPYPLKWASVWHESITLGQGR